MNKPLKEPTKFLWLDMEMTGLDPNTEAILEVAAVVTDMQLVNQSETYLSKMDEWNQTHHRDSGLLDLVRKQGRPQNIVENELVNLCERHFPDEGVILAGNSIFQDRLFIQKHMPRFFLKLHHRMLDVSAWKVVMTTRYRLKYEKKNAHRAIDDIFESIAELEFYLEYFKVPPNYFGSGH